MPCCGDSEAHVPVTHITKQRKCRDWPALLLFLAFWGGTIGAIFMASSKGGDPTLIGRF